MRNKGVFSMVGSSFTYVFIQQLLLFAILMCSIFAAAAVMFPGVSEGLSAAFVSSDAAPLCVAIEMVLSLPDEFMIMFLVMMAAAIFLSPVAGGAAAYLNDHAFKDKPCSLSKSMAFMRKNYGRLLGTYVLNIIITVALFLGYFILKFYVLHDGGEGWISRFAFPITLGWGIFSLLMIGAIQFSPFSCVYSKKGGGPALADSFRTFFKGDFLINLGYMIIGGIIWLAIAALPSYIVLLSYCGDGGKVSSLIYRINVPANDPLLWIVMILSFIVAALFMFDYSHAVFFRAKRSIALKYR